MSKVVIRNTAADLLIGEVDQAKIDAWKKEFPNGIYMVQVPESAPTHVGYFKNPSRLDVNYALSQISDTSPLNVLEAFANTCFIGGAEDVLNDNGMFLGICSVIKEKMNGVKAKLVNL